MTTRAARDQIIGKTQAAGRKPSTVGIARRHLVANAINRAMDCADTISTLLAARDSADPTSQEIAKRLLENKEFCAAMVSAIEKIQADVKAGMTKPNDKPVAAVPNEIGPDHPQADKPYTKDQMLRDLETQNAAAGSLSRGAGVDAANARVKRTPLIPAWDSPVWTADARAAFKKRAEVDGFARAHMAKAGDGIGTFNSTVSGDDTERAMLRLGAAPVEGNGPRSFDR